MKWNKVDTKEGSERLATKFLLFPKTLNGETRWLEWASFWQRWRCIAGIGCRWEDNRWQN